MAVAVDFTFHFQAKKGTFRGIFCIVMYLNDKIKKTSGHDDLNEMSTIDKMLKEVMHLMFSIVY